MARIHDPNHHRRLSLLLAAAIGAGAWMGTPTADSFIKDAAAQSRTEEKKQKVLDARAYEREQNRHLYGELANQKRQEAIAQLKKILAENTLNSDTKAEMLMRLAELYWEQSKYEYDLEMQVYEKDYDDWFNLPSKKQAKVTEPEVKRVRSIAYTRKAIENYKLILTNYPSYGRVDEALFFLAHSYDELGEQQDALQNYAKLVKSYPKSSFVPDAYVQIGEYYFDHNNAFKALQAYKRAAGFPESKLYTFALYKMGWCYYNVGEFETAIDTMKKVILEQDRIARETDQPVGVTLKEDALKDLVLFFSELPDALEQAKEFFTRQGEKKYYRKMLARLGKIYMEKGENELAVQTYRTLIAEEPYAKDNPSHQNQIIRAYWDRDKFEDANAEVTKLLATYGRDTRWHQENIDYKDALKEAEKLIEKNLRNVAIDSHKQALKRKSAKLLMLAEENYARYLDYFPTGHKSYELRYWYAETLYKLKKYEPAADQYEQVVQADPKGKFLKDAAVNSVFSIEAAIGKNAKKWKHDAGVEKKRRERLDDPKERYAPFTIRPLEQRLIDACDTYARVLPDDEKTLNLLYKAANIYADHNEFQKSNDRFLQIIRSDPKSELAQYSVHIILDSYVLIEDWTNLNSVAREFYSNPDVGKTKKFKQELFEIFQRSTLKIAERYAEQEKWAEAARGFDDFYREFDKSDVRDLALYNAAFYATKAGQRSHAIELRHEFITAFPEPVGKETKDAGLYERTVALLGQHYSAIADYKQSRDLFYALYQKNPEFEAEGYISAKDALYNAALFSLALGDTERAVKGFTDYVSSYPDAEDATATRLRAASVMREAGDLDAAMKAYKAIYSDKTVNTSDLQSTMSAYLAYGQIQGEKGDLSAMRKTYGVAIKHFDARIGKAGDAAGTAPYSAAEMRFQLLEPDFAKYAEIAMGADSRKASKALKAKGEELARLEKKYIGVLNLKQGEWGIAALYRIGTLYGNFADRLRGAECPTKLTEDQCEIYKFTLEDKAYPIVDKAVEAFSKAREKSYELELYTKYTEDTLTELSRLRPEEYPPNVEEIPIPDYTSNPFVTDDFLLD